MQRCLLLLLVCVGCRQLLGLHPLGSDAGGDDMVSTGDAVDAPPDTPIPDGGTCMGASAECVSDTLRTCSGAGGNPVDTLCSWGCKNSPIAHCGKLQPSGGGVAEGDLDPDATLADTMLSGIVDGDTGAISGVTSRAAGPGVINGIDFETRGQVAIFRFASLSTSGPIMLTGSHPIAFVANGNITISNLVDANGPCTNTTAGPGGYPGGAGGVTGNGGGPGGGKTGTGTSDDSGGGGGGGYGAAGGHGGNGQTRPGGQAGTFWGNADITVLVGGAGGGAGGNKGGDGGGGGGALQLSSNGVITIAAAGINAGGCHGRSTGSAAAGGGGGAGGAILIEAPSVVVPLTGVLAANGGGGGAGRGGSDGSDGLLSSVMAPGGMQGSSLGGAGGPGGSRANPPGNAGVDNQRNGGGGGGGVGWIKVSTRTGTAQLNGTTSPMADVGMANVQ